MRVRRGPRRPAPLLRPGGVLVVSEPPAGGDGGRGRPGSTRQDPARQDPKGSGMAPPAGTDRWPTDGLAQLGMVRGLTVHDEVTYQVVVQRVSCPERYPRRTGVPAKRPLFCF